MVNGASVGSAICLSEPVGAKWFRANSRVIYDRVPYTRIVEDAAARYAASQNLEPMHSGVS